MNRKLLTDIELRARWNRERPARIRIERDTMLTPAARDFVREHGIELCREESMTVVPAPKTGGRYVLAGTGKATDQKPEEMTHLRGNLLVQKVHPQIAFRGKLDSLMADMLCLQKQALAEHEEDAAAALGELLAFVREILSAEVREEPVRPVRLFGLDSGQIRAASQDVQRAFGIRHPIPDVSMSALCLELNRLRTRVRETELAAARAFYDEGKFTRTDIIEGLNRLSSAVYILFLRQLTGQRERV